MKIKPVKGLPPDLSSGETLTPSECEQRVQQARKDVLDELEYRFRELTNHEAQAMGVGVINDMRK